MSRFGSMLWGAIVGAVTFAAGAFGFQMLTGPKGDPSVYGVAMFSAMVAGAIGLVIGAIYGLRRA